MINFDYILPIILGSLIAFQTLVPLFQLIVHLSVSFVTENRVNIWDKYKFIGFVPKRVWYKSDIGEGYFGLLFLGGTLLSILSILCIGLELGFYLNLLVLLSSTFYLVLITLRKIFSISHKLNTHLKDAEAHAKR